MQYSTVKNQDAAAFRDRVLPKLLEAEAENCRIISLAIRIAETGIGGAASAPRMWTVESDAGVELVALQKAGDLMEISQGSAAAADVLIEALAADGGASAIVGPEPTIREVITRYATRALVVPRLHRRFKGHQLSHVIPPRQVSGGMRCADADDKQHLIEFIDAYTASINETAHANTPALADSLIAGRRMFFWCDPEPVAMAAWAGPTPNGIRINFVYTPQEVRGRGYASNLVGALTQRLLDEGRRSCFLFTDSSNAPAEKIYAGIGYQAISEGAHWVLDG